MTTPAVALTVAGSDSGGGAGLEADIKTFSALGVFATVAVTAVTAQSTRGVGARRTTPPSLLEAQIRAVVDDMDVRAVKTGMLPSEASVRVVTDLAGEGLLPNLVVDPVMVSSTGQRLADPAAAEACRRTLFPRALLVTPNLNEASLLVGRRLSSVPDMVAAAAEIRRCGATWVLVKGGHLPGDPVDVLAGEDEVLELRGHRVTSANQHGTGCTLSAAVAAHLALARDLPDAVALAKAFVEAAIEGSRGWRIGGGPGPLDQMGWEQARRRR